MRLWLLPLTGLAIAGAPGPAADPPTRPNVLVILSDDQSAAHVGCYGNPDVRTPNLDAFARTAVRFDRMYVTCPQCVPSRASLMTGRSPVAIGMTRFSAPLPAECVTWPEVLRKAGYFTGVAGRTYHLDGAPNPELTPIYERHKLRTFPDRLDFVKTAGDGDGSLRQLREFLDAVPAGKPFALQLCFSDPHRPYTAPKVHDSKALTLPKHYPDTSAVRADYAAYLDEIARLDADFGRVLAELDKRKVADNTLVLFLGDNGAAQWRGKGTLYEFGIRVPLLVRWPGVTKGVTVSGDLVSGEDLAPTVLEACGQKPLKEMTGKSFAPLLRGDKFEGRKYVFAERGAHGQGLPGTSSAFDLGRVVVSKTHKFVYNATFHLPYHGVDFGNTDMFKEVRELAKEKKLPDPLNALYDGRARLLFELFDLVNDPNEFVNLAGKPEASAIETELRAALVEWMVLERDFLPLP
ncbi:MAG TPA: sulfatase, partial [Gemmataceae bacterium]|nr:sulfatase [Gemmataceae bacterium]